MQGETERVETKIDQVRGKIEKQITIERTKRDRVR